MKITTPLLSEDVKLLQFTGYYLFFLLFDDNLRLVYRTQYFIDERISIDLRHINLQIKTSKIRFHREYIPSH